MDYIKIDKKFTDYIIDLLGPNEELDRQREDKFNFIKELIKNTFDKEDSEFIPHVFCFGSFPLKTYLNESDLDITVIFEDRIKKEFILNCSYNFSNKMLVLIQTSFENYNKEKKASIFSEINLIFADVKLIKCKYENLSIDICLNNFSGLTKLALMNFLDDKICERFGKDYSYFFKRTLILIKSWAYFEGGILGSSIGLLANYALEALVINVFNNYHHVFETEIDAFFCFLKFLKDIDWENKIVNIYGTINTDTYLQKTKDSEWNFTEEINYTNRDSNFILDPKDLFDFTKNYEIFKDIDKQLYFNANIKTIPIKFVNIIDPIFNNNNLGKSVNFHNFSKIKKVIEIVNNDVELILLSRNGLVSPLYYLNLLSKLFTKTITSQSSELFLSTLSQPKIVINPYLNIDESLQKNVNNSKERNVNEYEINFSKLNDNLIISFNKAFSKSESNFDNSFSCKEKYHNFEETKNDFITKIYCKFFFGFLVTKDIIEYMIKNQKHSQKCLYLPYYKTEVIENFLKFFIK